MANFGQDNLSLHSLQKKSNERLLRKSVGNMQTEGGTDVQRDGGGNSIGHKIANA